MVEQLLIHLWDHIGIRLQVSNLQVQDEKQVEDDVNDEQRLQSIVNPFALVFHLLAGLLENEVDDEVHIEGAGDED